MRTDKSGTARDEDARIRTKDCLHDYSEPHHRQPRERHRKRSTVCHAMQPSRSQPSIDVIIPAMNEAEALPWVLSRLPEGVRAIVVDNNSTDDTADVARAYGATVVTELVPGFGSACWAGLNSATADLVCFMDGDGSLDPQDLPKIFGPVADGTVDLMLGARRPIPGAMMWHQKLANRVLAYELCRRTGDSMSDLGPMRCADRVKLLSLNMVDRRSGWPLEMVLKAAHQNWRIAETGVPYAPRKGGKSKVTGTIKGTVRAIKDMGKLLVK
jgi:glycosyltransferase involved in cell wall biosynthesis